MPSQKCTIWEMYNKTRALLTFIKHGTGATFGDSAQNSHKWCFKEPCVAPELQGKYMRFQAFVAAMDL